MKKLIFSGALALALALTSAANAQGDGDLSWVPGGAVGMDISGSGTPLSLSDDGEVDIASTVSNGLFGAGARVGSNGAVRFAGVGTQLGFTNAAIPSNGQFGLADQSLAVFWDDINTSSGANGEIFQEEIGNTLIVQRERVGFFRSNDTGTFQMQVHGSGAPLASFLYRDIESARGNGGGSATIGYQDGGVPGLDVQFSFDTAGAVSNGTVMSLVPEPASLILLGLGGLALIRRR